MIRLSRRTDYGFLAIQHLCAAPPGAYRSAREIAARYSVPPAVMAKLLQRLARKGLVASHHGIKGGYQIARRPADITLWEIIEAIEGPVRSRCPHDSPSQCRRAGWCDRRRPVLEVQKRIAEVLGRTTLHDLAVLKDSEP
jgi:Rrf2 family protein